jgi:hypothetical protein
LFFSRKYKNPKNTDIKILRAYLKQVSAYGVQGVDWISPSIQLPLYYENKFDPLSHAPQTIPPLNPPPAGGQAYHIPYSFHAFAGLIQVHFRFFMTSAMF